jgi:hypothetical protein
LISTTKESRPNEHDSHAGREPAHPTDQLSVELVEVEADETVTILVRWPARPTAIDPAMFRDTAAAMVKLFSEVHVAVAATRRRRRL